MSEEKPRVLGVLSEKDLAEHNRIRIKRVSIQRSADALVRSVMHAVQHEMHAVEAEDDALMAKLVKEHHIAPSTYIEINQLNGEITEHVHVFDHPGVSIMGFRRRDDGGDGGGFKH